MHGGATTSSTYLGATTVDDSGEYARTRVDELGRTRVLSYDAQSTLVGATDVGGVNEWTYGYAPILGGDVSWDLDSGRVSLGANTAEPGVGQYAGRDESRDAAPAEATGRTTLYGYDEAGNVTRIEDPMGGVTTQRYDDAGQLVERTLPNGVVSTWAYNERGWIMEVAHRTATNDLIALARYTRSASGEPTRIEREDGSAVDVGYDGALRVASEAYSDDGETIGYGYDVDSNRTSRVTSAGSETYAYLAGALLAAVSVVGVPAETFAYDGAGRVTDLRGATVSWDADDHVTALGGRSWAFDAQGRRTRVDGVEHLVAPTLNEGLESPWLVMDTSGAARVGYVFGGEHPLERYDATTGARAYYLTDAMGSVIGLVGESPSDRATIHYDGFGNLRRTTGSATLAMIPSDTGGDFRFHGMWKEPGADGIYYVRARAYDAKTGRFLSRDPAPGSHEDPASYLVYAFAQNAPTRLMDPTGQWPLGDLMTALWVRVRLALAPLGTAAINFYQRIRDVFTRSAPAIEELGEGVSARGLQRSLLDVLRARSVQLIESGRLVGNNPQALRVIQNGDHRGYWVINTSLDGGLQRARDLFEVVAGRAPAGSFDTATLSNGTQVIFRMTSSWGNPRIEIVKTVGETIEKIGFN